MNKYRFTVLGLFLLFNLGMTQFQAEEESEYVYDLRNNQYLIENARLIDLAEESYAEGKYDDAVEYANRAMQYADLSDEYVASRMKSKEATVAINTTVLTDSPKTPVLPAQYRVKNRDTLWNIAGKPEIYGNPWQWRRIYNANRGKMPRPDNPNLIHPGMVLDIPSIAGEARAGIK